MHFVLLPRNQAVGQFVLVIGLPGKMTREDFAATIDRFADSLACSIASQSLGDYFRDLLPRRGLNFGVDAAVGEHFHPMLEKRNDNQYSGMIPCVVKTVLRKRGKRQGVDRRINAVFRADEPLDRGDLAQEKTRACANDRPEVDKRRCPRIAPEPFDDQAYE